MEEGTEMITRILRGVRIEGKEGARFKQRVIARFISGHR